MEIDSHTMEIDILSAQRVSQLPQCMRKMSKDISNAIVNWCKTAVDTHRGGWRGGRADHAHFPVEPYSASQTNESCT